MKFIKAEAADDGQVAVTFYADDNSKKSVTVSLEAISRLQIKPEKKRSSKKWT